MIELFDKETGALLGEITELQLEFLMNQLEEESLEDVDYYISQDTLDMFSDRGIDAELLEFLRTALGDREGMEVRWDRE